MERDNYVSSGQVVEFIPGCYDPVLAREIGRMMEDTRPKFDLDFAREIGRMMYRRSK